MIIWLPRCCTDEQTLLAPLDRKDELTHTAPPFRLDGQTLMAPPICKDGPTHVEATPPSAALAHQLVEQKEELFQNLQFGFSSALRGDMKAFLNDFAASFFINYYAASGDTDCPKPPARSLTDDAADMHTGAHDPDQDVLWLNSGEEETAWSEEFPDESDNELEDGFLRPSQTVFTSISQKTGGFLDKKWREVQSLLLKGAISQVSQLPN